MDDATLEGLKFWGLTALLNPLFLAFLLAVYFTGKFVGKLTIRPNIWKFLFLCYLGLFLFPNLRNAGPIIGGFFLLGFFSAHIRNIPSILSWAGGIGDFLFALRYRRAFEDIRRHEQELEEELRRARAQARSGQQGESEAQRQWRKEQEAERARKTEETERKSAGETKNGNKAQEKARQGDGQKSSGRTSGTGDSSPPTDDLRAKHLRTLGLDPKATFGFDELKSAYRKALKRTHPDAGGSAVEFIEVQNAWEWLVKSG
jgi:DnaJ-domain-containing protein 1